jgi:hypothetical protein
LTGTALRMDDSGVGSWFSSSNGSLRGGCTHVGTGCDCLLRPGYGAGTAEHLDEMQFTRSACAAAQQGNLAKLERILARDPGAVHKDGTAAGDCVCPDNLL